MALYEKEKYPHWACTFGAEELGGYPARPASLRRRKQWEALVSCTSAGAHAAVCGWSLSFMFGEDWAVWL